MSKGITAPTAVLQELYGLPLSGPLPQGEIDLKMVAIYVGGACLAAGVFAYCINRASERNAELWKAQFKKMDEEHTAALEKKDQIIHDLVREIKFQYELMKPKELATTDSKK